MRLDRKKIAEMRLMLIRCQNQTGDRPAGVLDCAELRERLASGAVLAELLALADAALSIRRVYLANPPECGVLGTMASIGGAAYRAMLDFDVLEDAARRAEGVVPITRKRRSRS